MLAGIPSVIARSAIRGDSVVSESLNETDITDLSSLYVASPCSALSGNTSLLPASDSGFAKISVTLPLSAMRPLSRIVTLLQILSTTDI